MKSLTVDEFKAWADKIDPALFTPDVFGRLRFHLYGYWGKEVDYSLFNTPASVVEFLGNPANMGEYRLLAVSLKNDQWRTVAILSADCLDHSFLPGDFIMGKDHDGYMMSYHVDKVVTCTGGSVFYSVSPCNEGETGFDYIAADDAIFFNRAEQNKICNECGRLYAGNPLRGDTSDCAYCGIPDEVTKALDKVKHGKQQPVQSSIFNDGQELPLFAGSAYGSAPVPFVEREAAKQAVLFAPTFDELARAAQSKRVKSAELKSKKSAQQKQAYKEQRDRWLK